ncbi:snoRNA-binding rRNA-processing protein [Gaertneriomyces sp. JEL0708]|nr:snoRNA-binding rRNA-processing protein [Gaertneriomyces sp. JEL0708]
MSDYRKVPVKRFPKAAGRKSAEATYWRKFQAPILVKEYASISSISFSPISPYDFAVTSSTRVQVYSTRSHTIKKTISRFKDTAYSGTIRGDGKLLVAGDASGLVQLFDLNSRAILRTLRGHDGAVHVAKFSPDHMQVLSGSDDKTVRVWDVPTETPVAIFGEHEDYVRAGLVSQEHPYLIATGSYDHTVRLWDVRSRTCTMTMKHGAPVESLLMFPGSGLLASAGGNSVKIWDLLSGGRMIQGLANHQKTITCMTFDGSASRLLTGSLDHHVKVYSTRDFKVVHNIKYPAPVQSIGVSPDDTHLVVGMNSGLLSMRQRLLKTEDIAAAKQKDLRRATKAYLKRGSEYQPEVHDIRVEAKRRRQLAAYDKLMRQFRYGDALDAVLSGSHRPIIIVSLLEELHRRQGLRIALSGRTEKSLEPVLRFLMKNITKPRYAPFLVKVSELVLDMYDRIMGESYVIDDMFSRLRQKVHTEIQTQEKLLEWLYSIYNIGFF